MGSEKKQEAYSSRLDPNTGRSELTGPDGFLVRFGPGYNPANLKLKDHLNSLHSTIQQQAAEIRKRDDEIERLREEVARRDRMRKSKVGICPLEKPRPLSPDDPRGGS